MKVLITSLCLLFLVGMLGSCSSTSELTIPNRPVASNGKSKPKTHAGNYLTMPEQQDKYRKTYLGSR